MSEDQAFPLFDEEQMGFARQFGQRVTFAPGETLIKSGQKNYPFFVFASGEVEIIEQHEEGETLIATHGPLAFSGDVDMLTGRASLFSARAKSEVVAYSLPAEQLRKLLGACPKFGEMLLEAFQTRRQYLKHLPFVGVQVVGKKNTPETSSLQEFLYKNHVPNKFFDSDTAAGQDRLVALGGTAEQLPFVCCNGTKFPNPTLIELASCIGIHHDVSQEQFDLTIVGSGPSGLAAAVYAASEGIRVLVIDRVGPGGQAGSSSKIENFIGFPSGLSGSELANRGYLQALKFGAKFIAPETVLGIEAESDGHYRLPLSSGQSVLTKCVLVSSGVTYRQLDLPGCSRLEGAGVYYAATSVEARGCEGETAVVVGGGNSAGQAAMFLSEHAQRVLLLIRGDDLTKSMSQYLCQRISTQANIELRKNTEVAEVCGGESVESIKMRNNVTGKIDESPCAGLFIFVGAKPHSDWLPQHVLRDEKGFILTGSSFFADAALQQHWKLDRPPCDLETTMPGVMASGDVRSGTTKRCGFAVGDGSLAVACVHRYLNELV